MYDLSERSKFKSIHTGQVFLCLHFFILSSILSRPNYLQKVLRDRPGYQTYTMSDLCLVLSLYAPFFLLVAFMRFLTFLLSNHRISLGLRLRFDSWYAIAMACLITPMETLVQPLKVTVYALHLIDPEFGVYFLVDSSDWTRYSIITLLSLEISIFTVCTLVKLSTLRPCFPEEGFFSKVPTSISEQSTLILSSFAIVCSIGKLHVLSSSADADTINIAVITLCFGKNLAMLAALCLSLWDLPFYHHSTESITLLGTCFALVLSVCTDIDDQLNPPYASFSSSLKKAVLVFTGSIGIIMLVVKYQYNTKDLEPSKISMIQIKNIMGQKSQKINIFELKKKCGLFMYHTKNCKKIGCSCYSVFTKYKKELIDHQNRKYENGLYLEDEQFTKASKKIKEAVYQTRNTLNQLIDDFFLELYFKNTKSQNFKVDYFKIVWALQRCFKLGEVMILVDHR